MNVNEVLIRRDVYAYNLNAKIRISRLNKAWRNRNIAEFQSILLEDADKQETEKFLTEFIAITNDGKFQENFKFF